MSKIEDDFDELFALDVNSYSEQEINIIDFDYGNFNTTNQTLNVQYKFNIPFDLGLNTGKSDYVMLTMNESYPWTEVLSPMVVIPKDKTL